MIGLAPIGLRAEAASPRAVSAPVATENRSKRTAPPGGRSSSRCRSECPFRSRPAETIPLPRWTFRPAPRPTVFRRTTGRSDHRGYRRPFPSIPGWTTGSGAPGPIRGSGRPPTPPCRRADEHDLRRRRHVARIDDVAQTDRGLNDPVVVIFRSVQRGCQIGHHMRRLYGDRRQEIGIDRDDMDQTVMDAGSVTSRIDAGYALDSRRGRPTTGRMEMSMRPAPSGRVGFGPVHESGAQRVDGDSGDLRKCCSECCYCKGDSRYLDDPRLPSR